MDSVYSFDDYCNEYGTWLKEQIKLALQNHGFEAELESENFLPSKTLEEILEGE